jgi:hypothetical protein
MVLAPHIRSVLRRRVVGITAVGGRIARMQGQQEPILNAAINVRGIRNVSRDCWENDVGVD